MAVESLDDQEKSGLKIQTNIKLEVFSVKSK